MTREHMIAILKTLIAFDELPSREEFIVELRKHVTLEEALLLTNAPVAETLGQISLGALLQAGHELRKEKE